MNVIIRSLRSDELPELYKLMATIFKKPKHEIEKNDILFVAELNQRSSTELIGFVRFSRKPDKLLLNGIGVKEDYRNQGVGKRLLDFSLKQIPHDLPVYLKVKPTNDPAIALYVKSGFFQKKYGDIFVMVRLPEN